MARHTLDQDPVFIRREAFRVQGDGLVQAHALADDGGFADRHAGTVIDKEGPRFQCRVKNVVFHWRSRAQVRPQRNESFRAWIYVFLRMKAMPSVVQFHYFPQI
jgi:hypothetical protein